MATPRRAIATLCEPEEIEVDQLSIYLMGQGQEKTLEAYGQHILPEFSGVAT